MEAIQALSGLTFMAVMTVVGVRLLMLARRHRQVPELLLALAFLLGGSLGASIEAAGMTTAEKFEHAGALFAVGKFFGMLGMLANCLFTWWVFRRDDPRGALAVVGVMSLVVTGFVGHALSGAFQTAIAERQWFLVELAGRLASPAWLGGEAFLYWRSMRRRVALGLAEPVVANRFLLWVLASIAGVVCLLTSVPPLYMSADNPFLVLDLLVFAAAGVGTATAYWLAFFPPARYRRWVEGRVAAA